ncbi:MAG TPA: efflux RND transporter periplasmic adaptor subunit [Desulfosarcina sp.]|nr:efflux RND transporter periplasmic adaptor subunit [Desulfosarcina sp.]
MKSGGSKIVLITLILLAAAGLGWLTFNRLADRTGPAGGGRSLKPIPVEVARIEHGSIALQRVFSGELEALAEFVVAPKVGGRVERVLVNIADTVARDQVVAELDNAEHVQAVAQARADLEVAKANLSEARSSLETADREFERTASLLKRGIASDSEFDAVRQDRMVKQAQLKVAEAQVVKAEAALQTANIRLGYTQVTAGWTGADNRRMVAERYVDEGQTVAANAPLLLIVDMDPIVGVVYVTERDYAHLQPGQAVTLTTDAYPEETFAGHIDRIAPVFRNATRQARIEMLVDNPNRRLKPGMFIRANVVLTRLADAVIVPEQALTKRNERYGVFIVGDDGRSVVWHTVGVGIRDGGRVQITGEGLTGRVVTLGQQLVDDGASITIPAERPPKGAGGNEAGS